MRLERVSGWVKIYRSMNVRSVVVSLDSGEAAFIVYLDNKNSSPPQSHTTQSANQRKKITLVFTMRHRSRTSPAAAADSSGESLMVMFTTCKGLNASGSLDCKSAWRGTAERRGWHTTREASRHGTRCEGWRTSDRRSAKGGWNAKYEP